MIKEINSFSKFPKTFIAVFMIFILIFHFPFVLSYDDSTGGEQSTAGSDSGGDTQSEQDRLQEDLEKAEKQLDELEAKVDELEANVNTVESKVDSLPDALNDKTGLQGRLGEMTAEISATRDQISSMRSSLTGSLAPTAADSTLTSAQLSSLSKDVESFTQQVSTYSATTLDAVDALNEELGTMNTAVDNFGELSGEVADKNAAKISNTLDKGIFSIDVNVIEEAKKGVENIEKSLTPQKYTDNVARTISQDLVGRIVDEAGISSLGRFNDAFEKAEDSYVGKGSFHESPFAQEMINSLTNPVTDIAGGFFGVNEDQVGTLAAFEQRINEMVNQQTAFTVLGLIASLGLSIFAPFAIGAGIFGLTTAVSTANNVFNEGMSIGEALSDATIGRFERTVNFLGADNFMRLDLSDEETTESEE